MTSGWKNNFLEKRNKAEKVVNKFLPVVVDESKPEDNRNAYGDLQRKSWYAEKYSTRESETNRFDEKSRNPRLGFLKKKKEKDKGKKQQAVHSRLYSTRHFCMVHLALRYSTTITFMDHLHGSTSSSIKTLEKAIFSAEILSFFTDVSGFKFKPWTW